MRQFTQRLMLVAMLAIASICNVWADDLAVGTYSYNPYSSTYYYGFTSASDCQLTVSFSGDWNYASFNYYWSDDNGSSWSVNGTFGSWASSQTFDITAGKTYALYLSSNYASSLTMTVSSTCGGGGGGSTVKDGDDAEHPITWNAGSNDIKNLISGEIWYVVSIPAGNKMTMAVPYYGGSDFTGYAGLSNASAKSNGISTTYNFDIYGYEMEYTNSGAAAVDFYICQSGSSYGSTGTANIAFEDLSTLNNAKSIGTPAFSIANNANVAAATSSILVTFPNFQKGALDDYNVKVFVNMSTGMTNIYSFTEFSGTANAGVSVPVSLESGKTYNFEVVMTKVDEYLFEYPETSIQFTAVSVADGSESNPFIITEAGVAGPDHGATYGNWTWYKYIVPSDGKVTISHTWSNADITTMGFIRVNGVQVQSNVPNSWSRGCSAGDVIMVALATESRTDSYLIKGSVSAPAAGETRALAKTLNVGSNSIAKVESGSMSNWYKFNLAANHEATLNFGLAIAAKYYIGSSVAGTNIENNDSGISELKYVNDESDAVDVFVEVTGTNDKTPVATLAIEEVQASVAGTGTSSDPYIITIGEELPGKSSGYDYVYYKYTATTDGMLTFDNSLISNNGYFYYGSSTSSCYSSFSGSVAVSAGQSIYLGLYVYSGTVSTVTFGFREAVQGEVVNNPLILNEGSNTIAEVNGVAMWYKLTVPAKKTFSLNVPSGTYMYKGATNATNESNGTSAESKYDNGNYVYGFEGNNKENSAVDLYFKVNYNYSSFTCNVVFADYEELDFSHVTGSGTASDMYNVIVDKIYPGGAYYAKKYYQYTADADCWFTVDVSNLSGSNSIYASTTKTNVTGSNYYNYGYSNGVQLTAGQSVYFCIEFYSDNSEKYVIFHAGEVPAGATPAKAHALVVGDNSIAAVNEWYSIAVPAGATLTFEPQAYMSYTAYAGLADANAQNNSLDLTYNNSTYASDLEYTNETGAELNVYIKPTYSNGPTNCVVALDIPTPATYERAVTVNSYGTICLPKSLTNYSGATFFDIAYADNNVLYLDEVLDTELEAGKPYIFLAEADVLTGDLEGEAVAAGSYHGLCGSFSKQLLKEVDAAAYNNGYLHVIVDNLYCKAGALTYVGENRAYINLNQVPTDPVAPSPSRRRVAMGSQDTQVTTAIEAIGSDAQAVKMMLEGKLYIIRGGQMYNVNGQLVK